MLISNITLPALRRALAGASILLLGTALLPSCAPPAPTETAVPSEAPAAEAKPVLIFQAEDFTGQSGEVVTESSGEEVTYVQTVAAESWLSFEVDVPVAGRYRVELRGNSKSVGSTAWIEDYTDNKDERTYDITGYLALQEDAEGLAFAVEQKDGSPLNKGLHRIKLHLLGEGARVDWLKLSLLVEHQTTPQTLTQEMTGEELELVWSDEFEGTGLPDSTKWTYDIGDWGWGNKELQYYTVGRLENTRLEDGNLVIEARKDDAGHQWTSARLTTRGKVAFVYGRIEFRAKVPPLRGNWAAGWTLGDNYVDELSWPYCGEIDIMESVGYEMDDATGNGKAHASIHCGAYYFKLGNQPTADIDVVDMDDAYHTYSVDWSPEGITAQVDGKTYFEYTDTASELAWPFGQAQNLILNLAMGGGWGGLKGMDENMTNQKLLIDYVRVYQRQ
ncbi:MAG: family 16 glycosylhydrolase [Bacteroidota bacterium]